jgi:hypothetical protein
MKYIDALKKYNEGKDKWCMPRKGTADYLQIIKMMKKISKIKKSASKYKEKDAKIKKIQGAIKTRLILNKKNDNKIIKYISNVSKKLSIKPNNNSKPHIFSDDIDKVVGNSIKSISSIKSINNINNINNKANIIKSFLQNKLVINKYNLANRINNYYLLKKKLALLRDSDCLEKKTFNGVNGYTIRNIINLEKKIGSKSKYGTIYLTSIPNIFGVYPIATKIMKNDNDNISEVRLMTLITNKIILKKLSRHFLIIFGSCTCNKRIADKLRLISINELANGDLKMLVNNKDLLRDVELLMNLLFQTYISIATFQNLVGYVHKDAHYGNFLYQLNNEMGYYHYVFNGKDYYLKACKYNIIIFDYGFARRINMNAKYDLALSNRESKRIFEDYRRIINAFLNKKSGWGNYLNLPDVNTNNRMLEIAVILDKILYNELISTTINNQQFHVRIFNSIIEDIFLKYTPRDMFITQRPPNVINETPFIIN